MQIFMRNIALSVSDMDLRLALASVLHRPPFPTDPLTNFDIDLFKDRKGYPIGILTLPTTELAVTFLRSYGSRGITVKHRPISFSQSTHQRDGQIQRVRASEWEDPTILQERKRKMANMSKTITLSDFSFGCFRRDGSFSSEIRVGGTGTIACDMELRQVQLVVTLPQSNAASKASKISVGIFNLDFSDLPQTKIYASYMPSHIVSVAASTGVEGPFRVFLESDSPPVFGVQKGVILSDNEHRERIPSITQGNTMPPVCQHLCLTFAAREDLDTFVERCKALRLPKPIAMDICLSAGGVYSEDNMAELEKFIGTLEFGLAFEAEKAVSMGVLEPTDLLKTLQKDVLSLQGKHQLQAAAIFRYFAGTLQTPSLAKSKVRNRRRRGRHPTSIQSGTVSLVEQLKEAVLTYLEDVYRPPNRYSASPAVFQSYHLIITPSRRVLEGPLPDQSNSVLRRFGHHESFLRVSFQDENGSKLRRDPNLGISDLLECRFRPLLIEGFRLAGRAFEFLGYSMSGLKEYSLWFVTPFDGDDKLIMNATRIRNQLGDFTNINHKPALLGARWAQAFSASDPSDTLAANEIQPLDDRRSSSGSLFTDGCGTISPELSRAVWSKLQRARRKSRRSVVPSCFQIRIGGAKGVVVQDPHLSGRVICLRPSQTKFEAPTVRTLDITATSARPIPMFLNRPLIVLLEHLGVQESSLIHFQDAAIQEVQAIHDSFSEAGKLFAQHGLGASFHLPSLFNNILVQLDLDVDNPSYDQLEAQGLRHELIENSLAYASTHVLREIKYRARIPVPGSVTLIGVSDEWDCLQEGEIYATVHDERKSHYQAIEGKVLITRSPQIHVGDVQFVEAVRRPELAHLTNVVVFSCKGQRSLPSMLGGGDLDGDIYNLILDPKLFPQKTAGPGSYIGLGHKITNHPCEVADIADFVIDYIKSDLVGYISILHLRIADLKGPDCDDCMKLAEKASHAVDFPKTGTPVDFTGLPKPDRLKPDYLSWEGTNIDASGSYYPSKKALGVLFRRVPMEDHLPRKYDNPTDGDKIYDALVRLDPYSLGLPSLELPPDDLMEEMSHMLWAYSDQLLVIAKTHTVTKSANARLTEAEIVSGTIQAKWADHRKRREAVAAMNLQTHELTKLVRRELREVNIQAPDEQNEQDEDEYDDYDDYDDEDWNAGAKESEIFSRAWAAWNVAEEALLDDRDSFGPQSFGLIALGIMLEVIKECRIAIARY